MKKLLILLLTATVAMSCCNKSNETENTTAQQPRIKNVIYMIGDGMGLNQIYAAMTANGGSLNIEACTTTGLAKTYSASDYITDSAAGGTALATGNKTKNGMIGMNPDSVNVYSILNSFQNAGLPVGIVVTCPITHATPSAFYAHQISRNLYENIAVDLYNSGVDFFCGGGRNHFENRGDSLNYTDSLRNKGYNIVYNIDSIKAPQLLPFGALAADIDLPRAEERGDYLPKAVDLAIKSLNAKGEGFFLMVEGSQIDYRCHGNDTVGVIAEVIDFDKAVKVALDFAKQNGETLVVITADHETGGLTIMNGNTQPSDLENDELSVVFCNANHGTVDIKFNTTGHTGTIVPVYSFGPGSEMFTGIMENIDIPKKIEKLALPLKE